jgi:hypothetical protein
MFAIPNRGHRTMATAVMMRKEGMKRGVPDVVLPISRGGYNCLFIEMKRVNAAPSDTNPDQLEWHERLRRFGNCVLICKGFEAAKESVCLYLAGGYKRP